ncbi:invasion associated locus B family protein [Jannaschia marina]|uniref:invasion associated locus B family protein n=1 Tax=Jannaschia marina TaxID=2741674 RepID=UPI0015C918A9|nr:invasion associated locus B family protein [Jannaschia marina]
MKLTNIASVLTSALAAAILALPAAAQDSSNRVNTETDWSVFVEDNPTQCWIVSAPKSIRNTRDGQEVAARRGDIRLFVSYWPGSDKKGEVSATGGYPYADGSTVTIQIGSDAFEMFTDGELAWAASPTDDERIITAMKRGAQAVVVGRSGRGTRTEDTFSLLGFTAAVADAENRCGS